MSRYTIPNLRRTCDWVHRCCHELVVADPRPTAAAWGPRLADAGDAAAQLHRQLRDDVSAIDASLEALRAETVDLTRPARQALAWMRYLADEPRLADHLATLGALHQAFAAERGTSTRLKSKTVWISLRPASTLYRITTGPDEVQLEVHQGYAGATPAVIRSLATLCLKPREPRSVAAIKRYSLSPRFIAVQQALEGEALQLADAPAGHHHDLEASFHRVRAAYFDTDLERPRRLLWTDQPTRCRLGYYNLALDAVVISRTLDDPKVPLFALDYVMHHELLHKVIGIRMRGSRTASHTPAFRELESRFRERREAEAVIERLVRQIGHSQRR